MNFNSSSPINKIKKALTGEDLFEITSLQSDQEQ